MFETLWLIPSGFLIAVSAFIAAIPSVIPTRWLDKWRWVRVAVIVVLVLSVAGELSILKHNQDENQSDQRKRDKEHSQEIANIREHFNTVEANQTALNDVIAVRIRQSYVPSQDSLKMRALDLSQEILQFLVSREITPGYGEGGFGAGPYGGANTSDAAYQKQTVDSFAASFQSRVFSIRDAFAKQGLANEQLNVEIRDPATPYSIRDIAEKIAALAEEVK